MHAARPTAVRLACAPRDETRAREIAQFLEEENFTVSIDQRLIGGNAGDRVTVVLWSRASVENWGVFDLAGAAQEARKLVQVTLDGTRRDDMGGQAPIDFRNWEYGQHHGPWRQLVECIDLVSRGSTASSGAPFTALVAIGGLSLAVISFTVSHRVAVGEFTPQAAAAATHEVAAMSYGDLAPPPALAGGPENPEVDLGLSDDFRFHRPRAPHPMRVNAIADLPNLTAPRAIAQPQIARPGIIRRMLNVAEDSIPFVRSSEDSRDVR
jgi:hypothetical protein